MDPIELMYSSEDEIPEAVRPLYTETDGSWNLTGVRGMKTQADIDRLNSALVKERDEHKATKGRLSPFTELGELDDIRSRLERLPELEAAAEGNLDEAKLAEMAAKRAEPIINREVGKLQRQLETTVAELTEARALNEKFETQNTRRSISDAIREAAAAEGVKLRPEAVDDAIMHGMALFEVTDDGVYTRAESPVGAGIDAKSWLLSLTSTKPHWFPSSAGGGARSGGGGGIANNPWSGDNWNLTKQAQFVREHGMERARVVARSVGSDVGATRPRPKPAR